MHISLRALLHIADNFHQSMLEIRNYMFEAYFQCYTLVWQLIRLLYSSGPKNKKFALKGQLKLVGRLDNKHKTSSLFGLHKWLTSSVL